MAYMAIIIGGDATNIKFDMAGFQSLEGLSLTGKGVVNSDSHHKWN